jgi:hypothetical protein
MVNVLSIHAPESDEVAQESNFHFMSIHCTAFARRLHGFFEKDWGREILLGAQV